jgi:hypothetical protein
MSSVPVRSSIFQTTLDEIDNKYIENTWRRNDSNECYDSTSNGEFRRHKHSQNNGKRFSYKASKEIRQRHRVQWIDECQQLPLVSENKHRFDECQQLPLVSENKHRFLQPSKTEPKSILKSTVNCLIIVSE